MQIVNLLYLALKKISKIKNCILCDRPVVILEFFFFFFYLREDFRTFFIQAVEIGLLILGLF